MMQGAMRPGRIVRFHDWPQEIRERWEAGRSPRSILDPDRLPLRWGPNMTLNVVAAYGAWLGWHELCGRGIPPATCKKPIPAQSRDRETRGASA
jgi:hypothetical protein